MFKKIARSALTELNKSVLKESGKLLTVVTAGVVANTLASISLSKLLGGVVTEIDLATLGYRLRRRLGDYVNENAVSFSRKTYPVINPITGKLSLVDYSRTVMGVDHKSCGFIPVRLPSGRVFIYSSRTNNETTGSVSGYRIFVRTSDLSELEILLQDLYLKPMRCHLHSNIRVWALAGEKAVNWKSRDATIPHLRDIPINLDTLEALNTLVDDMLAHWEQPVVSEQNYTQTVVFEGDFGTGKTYTASSLARSLSARLRIFPVDVTVDSFWTSIEKVKSRSVWLADEADKQKMFTDDYTTQPLTLVSAGGEPATSREVLNATTGPQAIRGGLIILVCNNRDALREGLRREGRGKTVIEFRPVNNEGLRYYFKNKYGYEVPEDIVFEDIKVCDYFKFENTHRHDVREIVAALPKKKV